VDPLFPGSGQFATSPVRYYLPYIPAVLFAFASSDCRKVARAETTLARCPFAILLAHEQRSTISATGYKQR